MIKDLINELKAIDEKLVPINILFDNIKYGCKAIQLNYPNSYGMNVRIYENRTLFINYVVGKCDITLFCNKSPSDFDLVMLLYENREKIIEIVLKYI